MTEIEKLIRLVENLIGKVNRIEAVVATVGSPHLADMTAHEIVDHALEQIDAAQRAHAEHRTTDLLAIIEQDIGRPKRFLR